MFPPDLLLVCVACRVDNRPGLAEPDSDGGRKWANQPLPAGLTTLTAVTCVSQVECWLAGQTGNEIEILRMNTVGTAITSVWPASGALGTAIAIHGLHLQMDTTPNS